MSDNSLNGPIVDAVQMSTEYNFGLAPMPDQTADANTALSAGAAIAYDKAAQAAAIAFQDVADYQRNIMSISTAVQGKSMALIMGGDVTPGPILAYVMALLSTAAATATGTADTSAWTTSLSEFPRG